MRSRLSLRLLIWRLFSRPPGGREWLVAGLMAALPLLVAAGPGSPPASTALRVGDWEVSARASFDVVSDQVNGRLHFVYAEVGRLHHAESSDGGATWTTPRHVASGYGQVMAVDSLGTLHLVYEAAMSTRMEYRTFAGGVWSEPRELSAHASPRETKLLAPRIAVDGNDNIHLIYWALGDVDESGNKNRCVYWYRRSGQAEFDPPELWKYDPAGERGWGKYGALAVDSDGHMHIFYAAGRFNHHAIERRVRYSDGRWGRRDHWLGRLLTDWCIGAAVDAAGVVHLAVQTRVGDALKVVYLNNRDDPAKLAIHHELGDEDFETFTQLRVEDGGDLWLVMGHRKFTRPAPGEEPAGMPDIGTYAHFDASTSTWSPRTPLSPDGRINLDTRRSGEPRIVKHDGVVRIFYAEKQPEGKWTHWQRVTGTPHPVPATPAAR